MSRTGNLIDEGQARPGLPFFVCAAAAALRHRRHGTRAPLARLAGEEADPRMAAHWQDHSIRRAIWWTRAFARPLQMEFASEDSQTPENLQDLLEQADRRLAASTDPRSED